MIIADNRVFAFICALLNRIWKTLSYQTKYVGKQRDWTDYKSNCLTNQERRCRDYVARILRVFASLRTNPDRVAVFGLLIPVLFSEKKGYLNIQLRFRDAAGIQPRTSWSVVRCLSS